MTIMCRCLYALHKSYNSLTTTKKIFLLFMSIVVFVCFNAALTFDPNSTRFCIFTHIDNYAPELEKIFRKIEQVNCKSWDSLVHFNASGFLNMDDDVARQRGYRNGLDCEYSNIISSGTSTHFTDGPFGLHVLPKTDLVSVTCKDSAKRAIYGDLLYQLKVLQDELPNLKEESTDHPSLIMFGFDSLSSLLAERTLPKTLAYMRKELNAYEMKHYTKVGLNTLPNMLAATTGKSVYEAFTPSMNRKHTELYQRVLDFGMIDCKGDDHLMPIPPFGFKYPQYKHNIRKLIEAGTYKKVFIRNANSTEDILASKHPLCFANKYKHNILIDFNKQCIERYHNKRKLVYSWTVDIAHDDSVQMQLADDDLLRFLTWMKTSGRLDRSVFVMYGDHGPGMDELSSTEIGRFTHRHPFLAMVLPNQFMSKKALDNLENNRYKLTTPFDLHETFLDILNSIPRMDEVGNHKLPRGISLFTEIPITRTCHDAHIPEQYCPCYKRENVSVDTSLSVKLGKFVASEINKILHDAGISKMCAKWIFVKVLSNHRLRVPTEENTKIDNRYSVGVRVNPDNSEFIATVQNVNSEADMSFLGTIDRINKYGDQPNCLSNKHVKFRPYCYCM